MPKRLLPLTLIGLLVLIQYPLWLGKGGWLRVWDLERQLATHRATNAKLVQRNAALEGEVRDLKQGSLAVEERARYELGMVRPDEVFVQINPAPAHPGPVASQPAVHPPGQARRAAAPGATRTAAATR